MSVTWATILFVYQHRTHQGSVLLVLFYHHISLKYICMQIYCICKAPVMWIAWASLDLDLSLTCQAPITAAGFQTTVLKPLRWWWRTTLGMQLCESVVLSLLAITPIFDDFVLLLVLSASPSNAFCNTSRESDASLGVGVAGGVGLVRASGGGGGSRCAQQRVRLATGYACFPHQTWLWRVLRPPLHLSL